MKKIIDSITEAAAGKAAESTKAILGGLKPTEQLLVVGLGLIGLSFISAQREENKKAQKGPRKT
ncbi:MAG: hypothetical protein WCG07_01650 [Candidatus Taylorbacteria bacterium]